MHLAKEVATLQELSGGRFTLGVGMGWHRHEFDFMGVEFKNRGRRADEAIRLMRALWSGERDFEGEFWSFHDATSQPHPSPQPEIWVGGSSERAIRRALELGDAWHPSRGSDAEHVRRVKEQHPETTPQIKSPLTSFPIWQMGSAISQVDEDETPFGGRKAGFTYNIGCCRETANASRGNATGLRSFWSALEPWHQTVYVNFLENEGEGRTRAACGADRYDRLKSLKRRYEPDNFFRINQNIPPTQPRGRRGRRASFRREHARGRACVPLM